MPCVLHLYTFSGKNVLHFTKILLTTVQLVYFFQLTDIRVFLHPFQDIKYLSIEEIWEKTKAAHAGYQPDTKAASEQLALF